MLPHTYTAEQAICLFTPYEGKLLTLENKEQILQDGGYYGDILSVEDMPEPEYLAVFDQLNDRLAKRLSVPILQLAQHFDETHPKDQPMALVSLARAGTPIGVVMADLLRNRFGRQVTHYSMSVIHKYGLDQHAMNYVLERHAPQNIVFLDGWVSQGRITKALEDSVAQWPGVSKTLYCLSDPSGIQNATATRDDLLLPSAVLNAAVSGLLSRTVYNPDGFHFAASYLDQKEVDRTQVFIEAMLKAVAELDQVPERNVLNGAQQKPLAKAQIDAICDAYNTKADNIKAGIGEVSRSLLRRIPRLVVVDDRAVEEADHLFWLAKQRNIPIQVERLDGPYRAFSVLS